MSTDLQAVFLAQMWAAAGKGHVEHCKGCACLAGPSQLASFWASQYRLGVGDDDQETYDPPGRPGAPQALRQRR